MILMLAHDSSGMILPIGSNIISAEVFVIFVDRLDSRIMNSMRVVTSE